MIENQARSHTSTSLAHRLMNLDCRHDLLIGGELMVI